MSHSKVKAVVVRNPAIIQDLTEIRRDMFRGSGKSGSLTAVAERLLTQQIERLKAETKRVADAAPSSQ